MGYVKSNFLHYKFINLTLKSKRGTKTRMAYNKMTNFSALACHTKTQSLTADEAGCVEAARLLAAGRLVALPTETVYGLGGNAASPEAVANIFAAKGRPHFNPLIAHVADMAAARQQGILNEQALLLAAHFWPGPLTLVVPFHPSGTVCDLARAGLNTLALRVPAHPIMQRVMRVLNAPIAAPSANRSGHVSPTQAAHVLADLSGRIDAILDGGAAVIGLESTIIACLEDQPVLLRSGGLAREAIEAVLGQNLRVSSGDNALIQAPGMLGSHYAPRARLRLNAAHVEQGEAALLFGAFQLEGLTPQSPRLNLSLKGDLTEAAANLFACLRALDQQGAASIAVSPIPATGLGEAIRDRLQRAAAPR
jgi:L-threonylcarbamoyladenylate synthase